MFSIVEAAVVVVGERADTVFFTSHVRNQYCGELVKLFTSVLWASYDRRNKTESKNKPIMYLLAAT